MRPGETEAGSAGTQPCRGITRWKLIEEDERGTASTAVLPFFLDFDRFPHALKIPAAKRRNTSYRKTATLHFTLNQDKGRLGAESAPYDPAVMDVSLIVPRGFVKSILSDVICRT